MDANPSGKNIGFQLRFPSSDLASVHGAYIHCMDGNAGHFTCGFPSTDLVYAKSPSRQRACSIPAPFHPYTISHLRPRAISPLHHISTPAPYFIFCCSSAFPLILSALFRTVTITYAHSVTSTITDAMLLPQRSSPGCSRVHLELRKQPGLQYTIYKFRIPYGISI